MTASRFSEPIFVSKPLMPNQEDFISNIKSIYESSWVTNMGSYHKEFEKQLLEYLNVDKIKVFNNGTIALTMAIKALDLPKNSEVITPAFTYAATPHSITWNNLKPVFADINDSLTLCPKAIEAAITPNTSAILPVHVYGLACDVEAIDAIAIKHNLKVVYDAAHAFGTTINNKSICEYGDATMLSFHATKLFNSIEGGAVISNNQTTNDKLYSQRNFGIVRITDEEAIRQGIKSSELIPEVGINGKLNELQSAWGLLNLKKVDEEKNKRSKMVQIYDQLFSQIKGVNPVDFPDHISRSYQYYPVLFENNARLSRDDFCKKLESYNIYARKYFYPLCSDFECYAHLPSASSANLTKSHQVADNIICMPLYSELLEDNRIENIVEIVEELLVC